MTQLDNSHFELHSANKDKIYRQEKLKKSNKAYIIIKVEALNKKLNMHPMYKAEDATVVFKNKDGVLHKVDVPGLIQAYKNEKSIKWKKVDVT